MNKQQLSGNPGGLFRGKKIQPYWQYHPAGLFFSRGYPESEPLLPQGEYTTTLWLRLDVINKLRYLYFMKKPDSSLGPDWDEDNVEHIAGHGLKPNQVEEVYYAEGPFPTIALENKKKHGLVTEYRYRLWGADASGLCIEAIIAPYPEHGVWRCVTAFPMSASTRKAYMKRVKG